MTHTDIVKFDNTTKANFTKWQRYILAAADKHPDRLHDILTTRALHPDKLLNYKKSYIAIGETFTGGTKQSYLISADKSAYVLLTDSISDKTTLQTLARKFNGEGHNAYDFICGLWNAKTDDDRRMVVYEKRAELIHAGATSGSKAHMTQFIEELLEYNEELDGSEYEMTDATATSTLLIALQKHNKPLVSAYRATKKASGVANWKDNFDGIWKDIQQQLESTEIADSHNATQEAKPEVLHTQMAEMEKLMVLNTQLMEKVTVLESRLNERSKPQNKPCEHCNVVHPKNSNVPSGCIGKALSDGKIDLDQAKKFFGRARDPELAATTAKAKYEAYQGKESSESAGSEGIKLKKRHVMMTQVTEEDSRACLKVDTQAEITIFNDPRYTSPPSTRRRPSTSARCSARVVPRGKARCRSSLTTARSSSSPTRTSAPRRQRTSSPPS